MLIRIKTLEQVGNDFEHGGQMWDAIVTMERFMREDRIVDVDNKFAWIGRSNGWGTSLHNVFGFHIWPAMIDETFNNRYTIYGEAIECMLK